MAYSREITQEEKDNMERLQKNLYECPVCGEKMQFDDDEKGTISFNCTGDSCMFRGDFDYYIVK